MALNECGDQSNPGEMEHDYLSAGFDNDAVVDPFILRPATRVYANGQAYAVTMTRKRMRRRRLSK